MSRTFAATEALQILKFRIFHAKTNNCASKLRQQKIPSHEERAKHRVSPISPSLWFLLLHCQGLQNEQVNVHSQHSWIALDSPPPHIKAAEKRSMKKEKSRGPYASGGRGGSWRTCCAWMMIAQCVSEQKNFLCRPLRQNIFALLAAT